LFYLPGYLREENYLEGSRFALIGAVFPAGMAAAVVVVVGIALLVATPAFSWYCVLLALVAMTGKVEWLPVVFASGIAAFGSSHFGDPTGYRTACYSVALGLLLLGITTRRKLATHRVRLAADGEVAASDPTIRPLLDARSRPPSIGWQQPGRP